MSNNESFIDEVTEEVRRDQLFGYLKKYGWIAGLVVAGIVGGAAWTEYNKAKAAAAAQAKGDAILSALEINDDAGRSEALAALPAGAVSSMLNAASLADLGDLDAARAALKEIVDDTTVEAVYRDAANFKLVLLDAETASVSDLETSMGLFLNPGHPLRLLAQEQVALAHVRAGDRETALATFSAIMDDAEVSRSLRQRTQGAIVALGGADAASN